MNTWKSVDDTRRERCESTSLHTRVNEISGSKRAENVYSIMRARAASSFPRGGIVGNAS